MMSHNRILFRASSTIDRIKSVAFKIIAIGVIIYLCFHFYENPGVISVIIFILLIIILLPDHSEVRVYENALEFSARHSFFNLFSRRWIYRFDRIDFVQVKYGLTKKQAIYSEIGIPARGSLYFWNTITLNLKDGKSNTIKSKVPKEKLEEAFEIAAKVAGIKVSFDE